MKKIPFLLIFLFLSNVLYSQSAEEYFKSGNAQKECDEGIYWLELLVETDFLKREEFETLKLDTEALLKMIRSVIITTKNKNS
jgi:four helix bundle protein